jgi:excisionase family DNA binding protein
MKTGSTTIIEQLRTRRGYVTSTEAMAILGVTRQTLCRWVAEGRIPAVRIGPSNKFDPAHLADWLEERQIGVAA